MNMSSIPVVTGERFLGHAHLFRGDRLAFLRSVGGTGALSRVRLLRRWVLMASSPETAHEVLVERANSFEKTPALRMVLKDVAGDGLFTSEGDLWKRQRRLMAPLFHAQQLSSYAASMSAVARRALDRMRDGDRLDLAHEMTRITMGVVAETLFGADTSDAADELGHALTVALKWIDDSLASTYLSVQMALFEAAEKAEAHVPAPLRDVRQRIEDALREPVLLPGRREPAYVEALRTLDRRIAGMIDDRRANPSERADLLSRLLLARDTEGRREGMSDAQVRDEANTLFVAGHETTANALAWTFYLLARNPEARARVQAEADAFGPEGPTSFAPDRLAYTTRAFKEALRLYPPLVVLGRRATEPVTLRGGALPERTLVFVNIYGIHTSPAVWPDPDRFDPDRFLPEREAVRHKSAWMPFGVGPRVCIGNHFALMEGPIVLATLMRSARFEIDPARTIEADAFATLRPKGGVPALVRRDRLS
ncbi:MAG TPA: cytochrome P450 [Polyangiaceae bacterium]|jgi:cytochrome P450